MLDLISLSNGFNAGKYIVGFESTLLNPNGKSLLIGRDSVAERLQPLGTSFVYFGRDTNWYPINHLPFIGLNFELPAIGGSGLTKSGCNTLYLGSSALTVQFKIYPNPSSGIFTIENFEANQKYQVYDINGRLIEASIINGQLDLSNELSGIYLLRVLNKVEGWLSKKLMKN